MSGGAGEVAVASETTSWPALETNGPPAALYLHFPFCAHRCHYCDFSVKRTPRPPVDAWLNAIQGELAWWFERTGWEPGGTVDTVFLGGGTPSLLGADGTARLGEALSTWFTLDAESTEWTVEANPASFDRELGEAWRGTGVNRVSLGVQALDDEALAWLGRLHDRRGAQESVAAAKASGFERISVDLMFGLPDEVDRDLDRELGEVAALDVSHVSLYGLTIEPRTPLAKWVESGRASPATGERYGDEFRRVSAALREAGYEHYEVSNFARPGQQCRHNWIYWNRSPYLGLGPSSHGFLPPHRIWNVFRWDRYERALRERAGPLAGWERLADADEALERIWLGLRTTRGISRALEAAGVESRLERWTEAGWIEPRGERWVATVDGWLRMDSMVAEIAEEEERWRSPY